MVYIDETTREVIDDPDLDLGSVEEETIDVRYHYAIDKPAEVEEVVIAEYPETGGVDVEYREISPEEGHWEMLNEEGVVLPYEIPLDTDDLPKDEDTPDLITIGVYHKYTAKELAVIEEEKKAAEEAARIEQEKQEIMNELPSRVDEIETAQEDVVLLLADIVGGAI